MSSAVGGLRGVLDRVGQAFHQPLNRIGQIFRQPPAPEVGKKLVYPVVPKTTRWTTGQISVSPLDGQRRLTDMICRQYDVSRTFVYRLLREGKVTVMRGRPVEVAVTEGEMDSSSVPATMVKEWRPRENMRVQAGDLITFSEVILPPRKDLIQPTSQNLTQDAIDYMRSLQIYKDERIIIINKPAGLAVHAGPGIKEHIEGWLGALQYDLPIAPLIVHRLDKGTSGALILARTREIAAELAKKIRENQVDKSIEKIYWAIVKGKPDKKHMKGE